MSAVAGARPSRWLRARRGATALALCAALAGCGGSSGNGSSSTASTATAAQSSAAAAGSSSAAPVGVLRAALEDVANSNGAQACTQLTAHGQKVLLSELPASAHLTSCDQALTSPSAVALVGSLLVNVQYHLVSVGPHSAVVVTSINGQPTPGGGRNVLVKSGGTWLIDRPAV